MTLEIQQDAAELKLRAERRAGELLAPLRLRGGNRKSKTPQGFLTLEALGIDDHQSSDWQQIAQLSTEDFDAYIYETREAQRRLTTHGVLRLAKDARRATP